jgi:hypothetical protein
MFITGKIAGDASGKFHAWPERIILLASYEETRSAAGDVFRLTLQLEGFADTVLLEGSDARGGWEKLRQSK